MGRACPIGQRCDVCAVPVSEPTAFDMAGGCWWCAECADLDDVVTGCDEDALEARCPDCRLCGRRVRGCDDAWVWSRSPVCADCPDPCVCRSDDDGECRPCALDIGECVCDGCAEGGAR